MMITLYRMAADDRLRYYTIHNRQRHLFAAYSFTVTWGAHPSAGREKLYTFESAVELERKLAELINRRLFNGFKVLYSYFGKSYIDAESAHRIFPSFVPAPTEGETYIRHA